MVVIGGASDVQLLNFSVKYYELNKGTCCIPTM